MHGQSPVLDADGQWRIMFFPLHLAVGMGRLSSASPRMRKCIAHEITLAMGTAGSTLAEYYHRRCCGRQRSTGQ